MFSRNHNFNSFLLHAFVSMFTKIVNPALRISKHAIYSKDESVSFYCHFFTVIQKELNTSPLSVFVVNINL